MAGLAAFQIGSEQPFYETHAVLYTYSFNFLRKDLGDQFTLTNAEILPHIVLAKRLQKIAPKNPTPPTTLGRGP